MLQFIIGFGLGVYAGTNYDCKPHVEKISLIIKEIGKNLPKEKEK